ncbi:MAG: metallophosphoesterase [Pedobacter sp.]|nr:MAG: metallophosphoesterase [Pedobacter sp.]
MRKFLVKILTKPVLKLSERYNSRPNRSRIFKALSDLYNEIEKGNEKKGSIIEFGPSDKFIIFSDQHKGARNYADDFILSEQNYLEALKWYNEEGFFFISLGDSEELWENTLAEVKKHNTKTFEAESTFLKRGSYYKVFGNHDLYWDNDPLAGINLESIYGEKVKIYEGAVLRTIIDGKQLDLLLTHGHQGDMQSDGNWFSKWFVSTIWAPLQSFLRINPNTPAYDNALKSIHNQMMYEWSTEQEKLMLITGHTHQPVFRSLTYLERLYHSLEQAKLNNDEKSIKELQHSLEDRIRKGEAAPIFKAFKPGYFNSGCCCFLDGDITGIEIDNGSIRLIKWEYNAQSDLPERIILEETSLKLMLEEL